MLPLLAPLVAPPSPPSVAVPAAAAIRVCGGDALLRAGGETHAALVRALAASEECPASEDRIHPFARVEANRAIALALRAAADTPGDGDRAALPSALRSAAALAAVTFNLSAPQPELRREATAALAAARILGANHEVDALLDQPLPGGGDAAPSVRVALADALAEEDAGAGVVLAGSDVPPPPRPFDTRPGPAARRPPDPATETGGGL